MRGTAWMLGVLMACALALPPDLYSQAPKPRPRPKKPPATKTTPQAPAPAPAPPPEPPPSDVTMRTRFVNGIQMSENVTYTRGPRQRVEFPGLVSITQCDLARTVFVNDKTKSYAVQAHVVAPAPAAEPPAPTASQAASPGPPARTGKVVYTTTITDTGDRKQMFGREARHIRTVTVKDATAATCLKGAETVELDGWYVDLPEVVSCPSAMARPADAAPQSGCADSIERRTVGTATYGAPVSSTTTVTTGDAEKKEVVTTSMEVTALEVTRLPAAQFDVPDGYTQVARVQDLVPAGTLTDAILGTPANGTSNVTPKHGGTTRVGVLEPANRTERSVIGPQARRDLVAGFRHSGVEAVPIAGDDPDAVKSLATRLECDYVLFSEVTDAKTTKPGKIGGLLHKAAGDANTEGQEVTIAWKLFTLEAPDTPKLSGTAKASSGGGFTVGSAIRLAAFAGSMYMNVTGMGGMMGMMGGGPMAAGAGGMGSFMDPRAGALNSLAQSFTSGGGGGSDADQSLRQALSKAFDTGAHDLELKLVKPSK